MHLLLQSVTGKLITGMILNDGLNELACVLKDIQKLSSDRAEDTPLYIPHDTGEKSFIDRMGKVCTNFQDLIFFILCLTN